MNFGPTGLPIKSSQGATPPAEFPFFIFLTFGPIGFPLYIHSFFFFSEKTLYIHSWLEKDPKSQKPKKQKYENKRLQKKSIRVMIIFLHLFWYKDNAHNTWVKTLAQWEFPK